MGGRVRRLAAGLILAIPAALSAVPAAADDAAPAGTVAAIVRVNLISADVQRLKRFYRDALGFTVVSEGVVGGAIAPVIARQWGLNKGARLYTIILRASDGETTLGLTGAVGQRLALRRPVGAGPPRGGDHYMILRVRSIGDIVARLKRMHVPVWRPLMSVTGGQEIGVTDPDGTRLIIEEGAA